MGEKLAKHTRGSCLNVNVNCVDRMIEMAALLGCGGLRDDTYHRHSFETLLPAVFNSVDQETQDSDEPSTMTDYQLQPTSSINEIKWENDLLKESISPNSCVSSVQTTTHDLPDRFNSKITPYVVKSCQSSPSKWEDQARSPTITEGSSTSSSNSSSLYEVLKPCSDYGFVPSTTPSSVSNVNDMSPCEQCQELCSQSLDAWMDHLGQYHPIPRQWPSSRLEQLIEGQRGSPYTAVIGSHKKRRADAIPRPLNSFMVSDAH